jgi:hypothetical protein
MQVGVSIEEFNYQHCFLFSHHKHQVCVLTIYLTGSGSVCDGDGTAAAGVVVVEEKEEEEEEQQHHQS